MNANELKDRVVQKEVEEVSIPTPAAQRSVAVKVVKLGTNPTTVQLQPEDCTLKAALDGFNTSGLNIRVNGRKVSDDYKLEENDIITLLPQIRGGKGGV